MTTADIEQLRRKRGVPKGQLTNLQKFFTQKNATATVFEIESRLAVRV